MGRRKSYDRDEVLGKAMRVFWERGFHATSTRDLAAAMDVNVYSLYAEFGSKEGLYEAALRHYDETVVTGYFQRLESADSGLADVREVVRFFGGAGRKNNPMLGCLLANAVTELAPNLASSQQFGAAYTARLIGAFDNALGNAVQQGELVADSPVAELARSLVVTLLGVFVLLRSGGEWTIMRDAAEQALAQVERFLPPQASRPARPNG